MQTWGSFPRTRWNFCDCRNLPSSGIFSSLESFVCLSSPSWSIFWTFISLLFPEPVKGETHPGRSESSIEKPFENMPFTRKLREKTHSKKILLMVNLKIQPLCTWKERISVKLSFSVYFKILDITTALKILSSIKLEPVHAVCEQWTSGAKIIWICIFSVNPEKRSERHFVRLRGAKTVVKFHPSPLCSYQLENLKNMWKFAACNRWKL